MKDQVQDPHALVINDDGHVFLWADDDLSVDDLRNYLLTYCRPSVSAVAYCVGDMSWPTLYPTTVGTHYREVSDPTDVRRTRLYRNAARFESESGGYFGAAIRLLHELGKPVLASFRMNDAHLTTPENPFVSEFWKSMSDARLGEPYGYYGGCLDYGVSEVREHFVERVLEFVRAYPEVDGVELDAMRSPFFFAPDQGAVKAHLLTDVIQLVKDGLAGLAAGLGRRYLLTANVPMSPELALESGLDVATWDADRIFDWISVGPYQTQMDLPIGAWKRVLRHTPIDAYIGVSPQTGQYLGIEEYRAAATATLGSGADGLYLFNLPCLHELAELVPTPNVDFALPDVRRFGQPDLSRTAAMLDELGEPTSYAGRAKRFLFHWSIDDRYRHFAPVLPPSPRGRSIAADFVWSERGSDVRPEIVLTFKIVNVTRPESFRLSINGEEVAPDVVTTAYAPNGRDLRIHTAPLEPYRTFTLRIDPMSLAVGVNTLIVEPVATDAALTKAPQLCELELHVTYPTPSSTNMAPL